MGLFDFMRQRHAVTGRGEEEMEALEEIHVKQVQEKVREVGRRAEEAEHLYRERSASIKRQAEELRRALGGLEKASLAADPRLASSVMMAKEAFIKRALASLSLHYPETFALRSLQAFSDELQDMLHYFSAVSPKQLYYLANYFREPSREVIQAVRGLEEAVRAFSAFLEDEGKVLGAVEELRGKAGGLAEKALAREKLEAAEGKLRKELEQLEGKQSQAEEDVKLFMSSKEWKEIEKMKQDREELLQDQEALRQEVRQAASACEKALEKALHGSAFRMPTDLFEAVVNRQGGVMKDLVQRALKRQDRLKPAEVKKLQALAGLLEDPSAIKQEERRLVQEVAGVEKILRSAAGFVERKQEAEAELDGITKRTEACRAEIAEVEKRQEQLKKIDGEERALVEQLLAQAGEKNVRIVSG